MTEPGPPHSEPGSLDETTQQQIIQQIGRIVLRSLPPLWQEAHIEYRAIGDHGELAAELVAPNGTVVPLGMHSEVETLFLQLRHGMYRPDRGTWISALYRLQHGGSYSVDFNGDYEPSWRAAPPVEAYADELTRYPRAEANTPSWLAERAGAPGTALRVAEVFDQGDDGRPTFDRPGIGAGEHEQLVQYLESAPIVLAARSWDTDQLAPDQPLSVPLTFHTDGSWIWPGAVGYYLRHHNVSPEAELTAHIRASGFRVPDVDERTRDQAVASITGEFRS
ncbi:hypothetical protein [Parasphingorhabdus pacifica]